MFGKKSTLYLKWKEEWDKYLKIQQGIEIANLGSTCDANNYDYSLWGKKGFNFASAPQDLYYDNQVLEQYGVFLKKKAIVIISLSEFTLLVDKYETDYHNYKYYGYIDKARVLNYKKWKKNFIHLAPGCLYPKLVKMECKDFLKKVFKLKRTYISEESIMETKSQRMMDGWIREFGWENGVVLKQEQYEKIKHSWELILKTINYCRQQEFRPVIVVPPFNHNLKKLMPKNILGECLWEYIDQIRKMDIQVVDMWECKELEKDKYYKNPICLNEDGKILFNRKMESILLKEL